MAKMLKLVGPMLEIKVDLKNKRQPFTLETLTKNMIFSIPEARRMRNYLTKKINYLETHQTHKRNGHAKPRRH